MKNSSKQSVKMDMLHGSLFDKMLMFAMPLAACSILQQLFNSVGTAVVGRFANSEALAAVGSNSSVIALMVTLFSGISLGSNVVIANYIGQNDTKRIPRVVHTAVSLALLSGVFFADSWTVCGSSDPFADGCTEGYHSSCNVISADLFSWNAIFYVI